ncbi:MAG: hypothetical protein EXQ74_00410 [Thermoleophilia bacterium]|nr:hypothetical protein [Thermoleophilia bacterium]
MTTVRVDITPTPEPDEAAAIAAAVAVLMAAGRTARGDRRPAAYRSVWRHTGIREGVARGRATKRRR